MRLDVVDLARFYASPLGGAAHAMIARRLATVWPQAAGLDMLAAGYATPFLEPYRADARRVVAAMPAAQGVERWPVDAKGAASLVDETHLPFCDAVFDRVLAVHLMEESDALRPMLRELWRVTAPEGRLVVVVANRRGLWARSEASPFGHGRSFTRTQLAEVLRDSMFEPVRWSRALYMPPIGWRPFLGGADAWESVGEKVFSRFGGLILVEAEKRIYAETPRGGRRLALSPVAQASGQGRGRGRPAPAWRARKL